MKLCDLNTSKALQELGYDGEYTKTYTDFDTCTVDVTGLKIPTEIPAPRLDDVAYWIRDKLGYYITVYPLDWGENGEILYRAECRSKETKWFRILFNTELLSTYDSALEAAVTKAIETIKSRK